MAQLPPSPFISNSTVSPRAVGSDVASSDLQPRAAAEAFEATCNESLQVQSERFCSDFQVNETSIYEPSSNEGRSEETPASAPPKNPDAGVLAKCNCGYAQCDDFDRPGCRAKAEGLDPWPDCPTNHIHEIFHWVRKLMRGHQGFVLNEPEFMADVEEEPLFIRDGDHLRRWEA